MGRGEKIMLKIVKGIDNGGIEVVSLQRILKTFVLVNKK